MEASLGAGWCRRGLSRQQQARAPLPSAYSRCYYHRRGSRGKGGDAGI